MDHHGFAAAYDFSEFGTIVDVDGATGNLVSANLGGSKSMALSSGAVLTR
jgi:hypothetical protein